MFGWLKSKSGLSTERWCVLVGAISLYSVGLYGLLGPSVATKSQRPEKGITTNQQSQTGDDTADKSLAATIDQPKTEAKNSHPTKESNEKDGAGMDWPTWI